MLSKSSFMLYLDCPRHLWAYANGKIDQSTVYEYVKHLSDQGYEVEKYGVKYINEVIKNNLNLSDNQIIFQNNVIDGQFQARVDALIYNPESNKYDIYEIKSSTKVGKNHIYDIAFQWLVLEKNYNIGKAYILHLNKNYVLQGNVDIDNLFMISDVTSDVLENLNDIEQVRIDALEIINTPTKNILASCYKPKECICIDLCHPELPEYSIYDLNRITPKKIDLLLEDNIVNITDVPDGFKLTDIQQNQLNVAKLGNEVIDFPKIQLELSKIEFPIYFIDYETYNPAIPYLSGYKPYDQIPFQWSLHILTEQGDLSHYEFIETSVIDSAPLFIQKLQDLVTNNGSMVVWNKSFEASRNRRIGEIYPEYSNFCESMNSRMFDLMDIFRNQIYDHPKFKGSYSIKNILPVLSPDLNYKNLTIQHGAAAMVGWKNMVFGDKPDIVKEQIRQSLLEYCKQDTFAMVRIYQELVKLG
jgi:predicted RecB family nuclease